MNSVEDIVAIKPAASGLSRLKSTAGTASAVILSLLFLLSGIWKLTDLDATAERMVQSLIPVMLSVPAAISVAICETFTGVLLLIPRFRRWGAWIAGLMLVAFMVYIGVMYRRLLGDECNCFPWIQRVVGPAFFVGDAAMLVLAALAGWWSVKSEGLRRAAIILVCMCVIAGGSYGVSVIRRSQADAPETATADGKPLPLRQGRVLLYFFDPECMHCFAVAQEMSKRHWGGTRVVALATRMPQFATPFLRDTGLRASISPDATALRKVFPFTDPPYAVALDHGKAVAAFNSGQMEGEAYYDTLKRLGLLNEDSAR